MSLRKEHVEVVTQIFGAIKDGDDQVIQAIGNQTQELQSWLLQLGQCISGQLNANDAHDQTQIQRENLRLQHEKEQWMLKGKQLEEEHFQRAAFQPALPPAQGEEMRLDSDTFSEYWAELEEMERDLFATCNQKNLPSIDQLCLAASATSLQAKRVLAIFNVDSSGGPNMKPELQELARHMGVQSLCDVTSIDLRAEASHVSRDGNCRVLWQTSPSRLQQELVEFQLHVLHIAEHSS